MLIKRNNSKAKAETFRKTDQLSSYIRRIIDVYSAMDIHQDFWLTNREKDFYVATIIHVLQDITNPISDEAIQIYKKYFHFQTNKSKISDYLNRIRKKKWVKYNKRKKELEIVSVFHGINLDGDMFDFNFRLLYETDRSDMDGSDREELA